MHLGPGLGQRLGAPVRSGEAQHRVPRLEEIPNDDGADEPRRTGHENTHENASLKSTFDPTAHKVGPSRSGFAARFKEAVGATPIDYLTRWRMLLAGDRLRAPGEPISVIAQSLGYESESAFSTAFKRVMGCSPRRYSRGRAPAVEAHETPGARVAPAR